MGYRPPITTDAKRRRKTGELRAVYTHIDASLHRQLKLEGFRREIPITQMIAEAIAAYLANGGKVSR